MSEDRHAGGERPDLWLQGFRALPSFVAVAIRGENPAEVPADKTTEDEVKN